MLCVGTYLTDVYAQSILPGRMVCVGVSLRHVYTEHPSWTDGVCRCTSQMCMHKASVLDGWCVQVYLTDVYTQSIRPGRMVCVGVSLRHVYTEHPSWTDTLCRCTSQTCMHKASVLDGWYV